MCYWARITFICFTLLAAPTLVLADIVVLDDGREVEGVVLSETSIEVAVRLETGAVVRLPRRRVAEIRRESWEYYVSKGDEAAEPSAALQFYEKALELNPSAPGLAEKIKSAKDGIAAIEREKADRAERQRRLATEANIMQEYNRLTEAVRPDQAQELLEREIKDKPWLIVPRIRLSEIYVRDRSPQGRLKYIETLVGLIANDPNNYYAIYAPQVVDAAEAVLVDAQASALMPFTDKDNMIGLVAPLTADNGRLLTASEYAERNSKPRTPAEQTLAKLEFLKTACMKRPTNQPTVGSEVTTFQAYGRELERANKKAELDALVEQWTKQADEYVTGGNVAKGAGLAEIVLVFNPRSPVAGAAAIATRLREARQFRQRRQFRSAEIALQAAEEIMPDSQEVAAEKVLLYSAMASSARQTGDMGAAMSAITQASAIRTNDAEARKAREEERQILGQMAETMAEQLATAGDYGNAINALQMAKATGGILQRLGYTSKENTYRDKLADSVAFQVMLAAGTKDYERIARLKAESQQFEVWNRARKTAEGEPDKTVEQIVNEVIAGVKKQAEEANTRQNFMDVFNLVGRLQPLYTEPELEKMYQNARAKVVAGGQLTIEFFRAAWSNSRGILLSLSENSVQFRGGPLNINEGGIYGGSITVGHTPGTDQYTISINRPSAADTARVQVLSPTRLMLQSYQSAPSSSPDGPIVFTANAVLQRLPEAPPPPPDTSTPPTGTSSDDES